MPRALPPRGPLDPPTKVGYTISQLLSKAYIGTPALPPIGFERQFQRRPMLRDGEGDEALEVGVLRYQQGPGIVSMSIEVDSELLVGRDKSCKIQVYGPKTSYFHLRFYAVRTSSALSIVCMNDLSSGTGYILNGKHFSSTRRFKLGSQTVGNRMIVLRDGDTIQIPDTPQVLKYKHNSAHFPISPSLNTHIDDWALFSTTSPHHYVDTNCWRIHNYPLGDGAFGVVNLATHKLGGVQAAIKTIDSRTSSETWRERLDSEVGNMKRLNHPNVMKVLDQIKNTGYQPMDLKDEEKDENDQSWDWTSRGIWKAHVVFELATGGDLFSFQESKGTLSEDETKFIAWQLVLGLDHLHANDVVHRDIKLENILLHNRNDFPRILIGDFGFSTTLKSTIERVPPSTSTDTGASYRHYEQVGTILYLPPERLKVFNRTVKMAGLGESLHGQARREKIGRKWIEEEKQLDNWALGVIVFHLIAFKHPFNGESNQNSPCTPIQDTKRKENKFKGKGKSRKRDESQETINQFNTQTQTQETQEDQELAPTKRKFLEMYMDIDDDGDEEQRYSTHSAGKGWAEYRKTHGEGTVGDKGDSSEVRAAGRILEDIKLFADKQPDHHWLPHEYWDPISSECKDFICDLLKMRVHQRMTVTGARDHQWFTSSQDDLDKLYNQVVVKGIHRPPALGGDDA